MSLGHNQNNNKISQHDGHIYHPKKTSKKQRVLSLNIAEYRLKQRIKSLKDFQTYEKTKVQRINLEKTEEMKKSSILNLVDMLGRKQNKNEVLDQYMGPQAQEDNSEKDDGIQLRYEEKKKEERKMKALPTFINFKLKQKKQLEKVGKYLKFQTRETFMPLVTDSSSELKMPHTHQRNIITPFPKELLKLKKYLKLNPVQKIKRRFTNDVSSTFRSDEESYKFNETSSLIFNQNLNETYSKDDLLQENQSRYLKMESSRKLDTVSLTKLEDRAITKPLSLRSRRDSSPFSRFESNLSKSKIKTKLKQIIIQGTDKNSKNESWPQYPQYDPTVTEAKVQKIISKFKTQIEKEVQLDQPHYRLQQKIQQDFRKQQRQIDESTLEERNPLGSGFDYKLKLQKQTYKKNMKELQNIRKFGKVDGLRHYIWANGVKRLKRF